MKLNTFSLFLFVFLSCTHKTADNNPIYEIINVDIDKAKNVNLSELYKSIRYLKLETNNDCYLPPCQIIKLVGDRIYLGSRYPNSKIYVFDKTGRYLFNIGKNGKGPGEWLSLSDFIVVNNNIIAASGGLGGFYFFDLNGNFIEKKIINGIPINLILQYNGDTIIGYTGNQISFYEGRKIKSNLIFLSVNDEKIYSDAIPIAECMLNFSHLGNNNLLNIDENYYYFNPYLDTIYQIKNNFRVDVRFILDFKKYSIPPEIRHNAYNKNKDFIQKIVQSGRVYIIQGLSGTENTIFLTFNRVVNKKPYTYYVYYYLKTKKTTCVAKLIDNMSFQGISTQFIPKKPLISKNGEQVWLLEPSKYLIEFNNLKNKYGIETLRERNPQLTKIFENTTDMDNPILVFLKFKE